MKLVIILLIAASLIGCASTLEPTKIFAGSWTSHSTSGQMSMVVFNEDGTATFYGKVGSPWAFTWEGRWKPENVTLVFLEKNSQPRAIGHINGNGRFYVYFNNEIYYFSRFTDRWNGD